MWTAGFIYRPCKLVKHQTSLILAASIFGLACKGSLAGDTPTTEVPPSVFLADPRVLAEAKAKFLAGDASLKPAFNCLFEEASEALRAKPVSVVEKRKIPPSGDKHDYMTQAPYFWPNPKTTNGLPYIRRDGERNPESCRDSDEFRLVATSGEVQALGLALYFTGNEKYAAKGAELLRGFFLDHATRMNPNLNYAQAVPGVNTGRGIGLIETHSMARFIDALRLLAKSTSWSPAEQEAMNSWLDTYLTWLTTSRNGREEADAQNNHGSFFDTQLISLARQCGHTNLVNQTLGLVQTKRIARQIEPDGKQPLELARTKSLGYSVFNLGALMDLANLGKNSGDDFWHFQTADGRSIRKALEYILPYADSEKKWPHQQIEVFQRAHLAELLLRASGEFPDPGIAEALKFFPADELATSRVRLLFKTASLESVHSHGTKN
jgi:hypothetical protein